MPSAHETLKLTYTVPHAGEILGIGRSAAYEGARTGEIPTIKIGKRILVPVAALERMLSEAGIGESQPTEMAETNHG